MALRINTNVQSVTAQHRLADTRDNLEHTQDKLASGSRIVKAMDDAAGLAISEGFRAQMRSTAQNIRNTQDSFSLLQTADGAISEISNIVIRMKELAVQAASDTNGDAERVYIDNEYQQLKLELKRISDSTQFNGRPLLSGDGGQISVQVGPNNEDIVDRITIDANFIMNPESLGIDGLDVLTNDNARASLDPINVALGRIATVRGQIGAGESRLNATMRSLMQYEENATAAFSRIRDADIAYETAQYAKLNILSQAGVAMLSQANSSPGLALKLLQQ